MIQSRKKSSAGFTLIELLIVVSIIAILSVVVVTNLGSARAKARDAKISQDLHSIDQALALVNSNNQVSASYDGTDTSTGTMFNTVIALLKTNNYIPANTSIAHPGSTGTPSYNYEYSGLVSGVALSYRLCAHLEKPTEEAKPWMIDENGSVYYSATDQCGSKPVAQ